MNTTLHQIQDLFPKAITELEMDKEAKEYNGCSFKLHNKTIVFRSGKITPKKIGQFVTYWTRNTKGITEPYNENDSIDFYIIHCTNGTNTGQFIFPKSVLVQQAILTTSHKDGKRGFRVYPPWDCPTSIQAIKTQQWQLVYFLELENENNHEKIKALLEK